MAVANRLVMIMKNGQLHKYDTQAVRHRATA